MKLYDRLPDAVVVDGKRIRVDLDFRNVLRMLETLQRSDLMPEAKEYLASRCVCRRPRPGVVQAVREMLFPAKKIDQQEQKKITSFEQDAWLIRAAFMQCYGISLWRVKHLHWMEFADLLHAIPDGTRYMETIGIRVREIPAPTKYNQKEREWLIKAKASVALEIPEEERMEKYGRDVQNIFAALLPHAKEVKEWQTDGSSSK